MRILIFGKTGQLAQQFNILSRDFQVRQLGSEQLNFLNPLAVAEEIRNYKPSHIINAAAYTAVDKAESEKDLALSINSEILHTIGTEAKKLNSHVIHFSTDYVFNGQKNAAYCEEDAVDPVNYYGFTKLQGEKMLMATECSFFIFRVSWVYGPTGNNFLKTILGLLSSREELKIVNDQRGAPTSSFEIASSIMTILKDSNFADKGGLYHMAPAGETTWYDFAKKILQFALEKPEKFKVITQSITPISSSQYPAVAERPSNSVLSSGKLKKNFGVELGTWQEGLRHVFDIL